MTKVYFSCIFLLLSVFNCSFLTAQTDTITKITFSYSVGGSSWSRPGIYSKGEFLELVPDKDGNFIYSIYFKTFESAGDDGKTFTQDTLMMPLFNHKAASKKNVYGWVKELLVDRDNFTAGYLLSHLKKPSKKEIKKAAIESGSDDFVLSNYNERSDIRALVSEIKRFKNLDVFVKDTGVHCSHPFFVEDVWNMLIVTIYSNNNVTVFQSQFLDGIGQPIMRCSNNNGEYKTDSIINLEVNRVAQKFLPKSTMIYKVLEINNITNAYMRWYFENAYMFTD